MRTSFFILAILFLFAIAACTSNGANPVELTPEQITKLKIDTLKMNVRDGDIITRLNDNIVSYHVRNLNDSDRTFSHAGIVMTINGQKVVCNIDAGEKDMDTVRYDPIDSFVNPKENFNCGLFRFKIPESEKMAFINELKAYHDKNVHFDKYFDYETDSLLYCSEMIAKALTRVTQGRISFKKRLLPRAMLPLLYKFFEQVNLPPKVVAARLYVPVDQIYMNDSCEELMRFKLKHLPGDEQSQ